MTTQFPAQIDTNITLPLVQDNLTTLNAQSINQLQQAIIAIEVDIGIGAASTYTTIAARLNAIQAEISGTTNVVFAGDLSGSSSSQLVVGLSGFPISNIAPFSGQALVYNGTSYVPTTISDILTEPYVVTLTTYSNYVEVGQAIGAIGGLVFAATYTQPPIVATVVDNQGNPPQNVFTAITPSTPPNVFVYNQSYEYSNYPSVPNSVTFTLTASDGAQSGIGTAQVIWTQRLYYGTGTPGGSTAGFIMALENNPLTVLNAVNFTVNATAEQSIYFAARSGYGAASFYVDGVLGGFNSGTTISVTNDYGFTENYTLYQSDQVGLGITTLQVFFPSTENLVDLDGLFSPGSGEESGGQTIVVSPLKTSNYQVVEGDYLIAVGTLAAPITITLPANPVIGNVFVVKDCNGSATAFAITVVGSAGYTIDGVSSFDIGVNYESITIALTSELNWSII